jgi:N-acetylneuraminic acid mutarotase
MRRSEREAKKKNRFVFAALLLLLLLLSTATLVHADGGYWQQVVPTGDAPGPRYDSAGAWLDGSFHIFGGMVEESPGLPRNDLWKWHEGENKWHEVSPTNPPSPRYGHTMVECNGKFYAFAGKDDSGGEHFYDMWEYDPVTKQWTQKSSTWTQLAFHAMTGIGSKIFVFGGLVRYEDTPGVYYEYPSNGVHSYNIPTDKWKYYGGPKKVAPRTGASLVTHNGKLNLFGGKGKNGDPLNDLWEYVPTTDTWTRLPGLPLSGRSGHSAVVDGDKMRVFGGDDGDEDLQENWEYNYETATWEQKANVPVKLSGSTAVNDGKGKTYVFGGTSGGVANNALWLYIDAEKPKTLKDWSKTSTAKGNAPRALEKGDPVNTAHGNYHFRSTLLDPGGLIPLHLSIFYDSAFIPFDGTTLFESPYWCINHHLFLNQSGNEALFEDGSSDGNVVAFIGTDGNGDGDYEDAEDSWRVCEDESVKFQFNQTPSSNYILDPIKEVHLESFFG